MYHVLRRVLRRVGGAMGRRLEARLRDKKSMTFDPSWYSY